MGYCQHWYRPAVIAADTFRRIRTDIEKLILPLADFGVPLASGDGDNEPEISDELIEFNGIYECGHPKNEDIGIPYPTDDARGVGPSEGAIADVSLVTKLKHRCCRGKCCHEPFVFPRIAHPSKNESDDEETKGLVFYWTKTAFKPYDVAVTAALLIAKRYLGDLLVVHSNGLDAQWADAKELCQEHLGYGAWFGIIEDPRIELWPGPNGTEQEREVRVRLLIEMNPEAFQL